MNVDADLLVQRALWAGQHALLLFFLLLVLLLAGICAVWWGLRRGEARRWQSSMSPTLVPGMKIAVGAAVMLAGASVFTLLAGQLANGGALGRADQALTKALRASLSTEALQVFAALTHLADTATLTGLCIIVALALIAFGQRWLALGWVVALAGNGVLNQTLKQIFARVRPLDPESSVIAQGFSFPSGHSSGAVVAYGMLAYLALRLLPARWHLSALLAAVALALTVGASRLFLRLHFAIDVIAGYSSGAAWLALCVTCIEFSRWRCQRTA